MSRCLRFLRCFAIGLAVTLATGGCSDLPTDPLGASRLEPAATVPGGPPAEVLGLDPLGGGTAGTTTKSQIVGILGGTVSAGDFTVVIPPAAILGTATVTVSQPDLAHPVVFLDISPASANNFLLPVLLIADAKRMDRSLLSAACISYYNPAKRQWERVSGSTVSLLDLTVTAPLWHFSAYRVTAGGKAGW